MTRKKKEDKKSLARGEYKITITLRGNYNDILVMS